ncbi:MAG: SDR family oxidoreductase [Bacteroidia bacterium]
MLVVTGGSGFLGTYVICELLSNGHSVRAIKRKNSDLSEFILIAKYKFPKTHPEILNRVEWIEADVNDIINLDLAFKGASMVFHCAAKVKFNQGVDELKKINVEGTANVVNACLENKVEKLIYVSSTAALGRINNNSTIVEENYWVDDKNNTLYAESKHEAELEVWRGIEEGLKAVIVNPGIILGYGDWSKGSCRLFYNVFKGLKFYTKGVNGFVGVEDVSKGMLELANSRITNERFLFISENISYEDLFSRMASRFNIKGPSILVKEIYLPFISWILKLYSLANSSSNLSPETLRTSVKKFKYSNTKIKESIGYEFESIDTVLDKACEAYISKK